MLLTGKWTAHALDHRDRPVSIDTTVPGEIHPELAKAYVDALNEAVASIEANRELAIEKYLKVTEDRTDRALIAEILDDPKHTFGSTPLCTMKVAKFMHKIGILKTEPAQWSDYFFSATSSGTGS